MLVVTELSSDPAAGAVLSHLGLPTSLGGASARLWMGRPGAAADLPAAGFAVRWSSPRRHWLWLHVVPLQRHQGIGRALLAAAQNDAAGDRPWRLVDAVAASDRDWFLRHGFVSWGQIYEYAFDLEASAQALERPWERLKRRIPVQADMLSLAQAKQNGWMPEIARLQAQAVGGLASMVLERIAQAQRTGSDEGVSLAHSLVVVLDNALLAFALKRFDTALNCWVIDGFYVAPAYRNGWVTLWLRYELMQAGLRLSRANEFRVRARDDQTSTLAFARRMGAQAQELRYLMETSSVTEARGTPTALSGQKGALKGGS